MGKPLFSLINVGLVVLFLALMALAAMVIYSNFIVETKTTIPKISIHVPMGQADSNKKEIKDGIDDALKQTAEQAFCIGRKEAQEEYDKNFVTLLTILTIFGIAWPIIVGIIQFRSNESEMKRIEDSFKLQEEKIEVLRKDQEVKQEVKLEILRKDQEVKQEVKLEILRKKTHSTLVDFQKDILEKMSGVMAQVSGQMTELDDSLYCIFVTFVFAYQGDSDAKNDFLKCLETEFLKLKGWRDGQKKKQVVSAMIGFLNNNRVDPETKKVLERLKDTAIETQIIPKNIKNLEKKDK